MENAELCERLLEIAKLVPGWTHYYEDTFEGYEESLQPVAKELYALYTELKREKYLLVY